MDQDNSNIAPYVAMNENNLESSYSHPRSIRGNSMSSVPDTKSLQHLKRNSLVLPKAPKTQIKKKGWKIIKYIFLNFKLKCQNLLFVNLLYRKELAGSNDVKRFYRAKKRSQLAARVICCSNRSKFWPMNLSF